ncbi:unnamed protein product [Ixodes pacificus]
MKAQCAKRLGKEIQGNTEVLRGVGGECMSLGELRVEIRCDVHEMDETTMRIVGDNVFTGPDVIIGTDIIDHPHLVLIRKHGQTALVDERRYPFLQDFHVEMDDNRVVHHIPVVGAVDCDVTLKRGQVVSRCQSSPMNPDVPDVYSRAWKTGEDAPITAEEVNVGLTITEDERRELCQVIIEHRTCFAQNMTELGRTDVVTMKIEEKPGSAPVKRPPYRAS